MSIADELWRLEQLRERGSISEAEFATAKQQLMAGEDCGARAVRAVNGFRRSRADRWVAGVCGGLAQATGLASWVWRLVLALVALCGGFGVVLYLLAWLCVPLQEEPAHVQA